MEQAGVKAAKDLVPECMRLEALRDRLPRLGDVGQSQFRPLLVGMSASGVSDFAFGEGSSALSL